MRTENNIAPLSDNAEKSRKEGRKENGRYVTTRKEPPIKPLPQSAQ